MMFNPLYILFLQGDMPERQPLILPDSVQKQNFAEAINKIVNADYHQLIINLAQETVWIVIKVLCAMAIWAIGRLVIRWVLRLLERTFERRNVDTSLRTFLRNFIKVILSLIVILTVVQMLGVNITSIIALFASATLAIGMALSGTMQNFAGGVMILLMKPYRVGDYIAAQGQAGFVTEIMLFSTKIQTTDNQTIYIPNSSIATAIIDNYSAAELRRVDIKVCISYGDDVESARAAILELCRADERVLHDPEPVVWLAELGDSSVNLTVRMWVKNADYWEVLFQMNERIYKTLPSKGIRFPFPQLDVHLKKEE